VSEGSGRDNGWPPWFENGVAVPFKAGITHEFIVHGDINGLVKNIEFAEDDENDSPYIGVTEFFEKVFDGSEIVMFYNIASGLKFLNPNMEREFIKTLIQEDGGSKSDPVALEKMKQMMKMGLPTDPANCLPLVEKILEIKEEVVLIVQSGHTLSPAGLTGMMPDGMDRVNTERLKNWAQSSKIKANNNIIILLTDRAAKISGELRFGGGRVHEVLIERPGYDERKEFIETVTGNDEEYKYLEKRLDRLQKTLKRLGKNSKRRANIESDIKLYEERIGKIDRAFGLSKDLDVKVIAASTQGMNLWQIYEIFLKAKNLGETIDLNFVKSKKVEILNAEYGDIMEVVEPEKGLDDIGGLEHVKSYLTGVLRAIKNNQTRLVPMGATLMGPPGTGKTAIVEALAKEASFTFVKIKSLRSMWVGESELRMEKLVEGLRSLAPVVVLNDEADLVEAGRDAYKGDSGVSERLMRMWMMLLSDPKIRGKILVMSCTNRPDRIDPALKRSGRSDDRILIPMPFEGERVEIFKVMFKRHNIVTEIVDFGPFAHETLGLSGADIEKIVLNAGRFAAENKEEAVGSGCLTDAILDFIPSASQADIDKMTLLGILESSSRRMLPKNIKDIVMQIIERKLVPADELLAIIQLIKDRHIVDFS